MITVSGPSLEHCRFIHRFGWVLCWPERHTHTHTHSTEGVAVSMSGLSLTHRLLPFWVQQSQLFLSVLWVCLSLQVIHELICSRPTVGFHHVWLVDFIAGRSLFRLRRSSFDTPCVNLFNEHCDFICHFVTCFGPRCQFTHYISHVKTFWICCTAQQEF